MSTGLYEELGIPTDATQEQVRKAYKKKALLTHPDRLPQGATPADKAASEEGFRKVNNAYEVLSDPKKRSEYDIHGIWPPPEEEEVPTSHWSGGAHYRPSPSHARHPSRSQTFPDPFFSNHHTPFHAFAFTDPFTLFDSIFEGTPFQTRSSRHRHPSFDRPMDPFNHLHRMQAEIENFMEDIDRDPFGMGGGFPRFAPMAQMPAFPALESPSFGNRGRFVSESHMTSMVNGVTQTIHKRVDSDGNEHVTRTLPDGRQIRTVNGIEQQPRGRNPYADPSKNRRLPESSHRYLSPAHPHLQPIASTSRMEYGGPPSPVYASHPRAYRDGPPPVDPHRRTRRSSEHYVYSTCSNPDHRSHEERQHKKKWWQGGHQ